MLTIVLADCLFFALLLNRNVLVTCPLELWHNPNDRCSPRDRPLRADVARILLFIQIPESLNPCSSLALRLLIHFVKKSHVCLTVEGWRRLS